MKRIRAAILMFDIMMGLLLLCLGINKPEEVAAVSQTGDTFITEKKKIALTFDDGPHPSYTEILLDGLRERGVVVTFFVTGEHAVLHPDIITRMQEEGHLIGNHTYSHMQLRSDNREEFKEELVATSEVVEEIIGKIIAEYGEKSSILLI